MNLASPVSRRREIPEIVQIVLNQLTRLLAENAITQRKFETQLTRLSAEELEPRDLCLSVRELAEGRRRFVIQDARGSVYQMFDCNGKCEPIAAECDGVEQQRAAPGVN